VYLEATQVLRSLAESR